MKKFVEVMEVRKRGSGLSSLTIQSPSCSSWRARNAIELLSGDQRGVEAFQPEGSNCRGVERMSDQSAEGAGDVGRRGVGVGSGAAYDSRPRRTSQRLVSDLSSSTLE